MKKFIENIKGMKKKNKILNYNIAFNDFFNVIL